MRDPSSPCISKHSSASSSPSEPPVANPDYQIVIEPRPSRDGGFYLALVPDLPRCRSDGATRKKAAHNVADASEACIEEAAFIGRSIPAAARHLVPAQ